MVSDILTPTRLLVLLGVVLLVPVGLLGGFDAAATEETPVVAVGDTVKVAPFSLTVTAARYADALPPIAPTQDGTKYVFLAVEVTNTSASPVSSTTLTDAVATDLQVATYDGSGGTAIRPSVYRTEDSLSASTYPPDVMVPSVLVWQVDAETALPDAVVVSLRGQTWRASSLDGGMGWRDPSAAATLDVPLSPLAGA